MRLLVNHQLVSVMIQPKSISYEQICYKRSQGIAVTSLHCLLFPASKKKQKQRPKTNLEKCYQCSVGIEMISGPQSLFFAGNALKSTI